MLGKEIKLSQKEPELSQQELNPRVKSLIRDFGDVFKKDPDFQKAAADSFFSPELPMKMDSDRYPFEDRISFIKGLDTWQIWRSVGYTKNALLECVKIQVYRDSDFARGADVVILTLPHFSVSDSGAEISYEHRGSTLMRSLRFDEVHRNTQLTFQKAREMLTAFKTVSTS